MTNGKIRLLTVGSIACWMLALALPAVGRRWLTIEVLILTNMVVLSAAITVTVLAVVARSLPPVAAAWFLGYREASRREPERDDGPRLRAVGR